MDPTNSAPAPGAPTPDAPPTPTPTPGAPGVPAPPAPTPSGLDPSAPVDVATLPPNVQQLIRSLRDEAGKHRTEKTSAQDQLSKVLAALGLKPDGSQAVDPAALAEQYKTQLDDARAQNWANATKLELHQVAGVLGANAPRLLDSVTFLDSLDDLEAAPGSPEFRQALEARVRDAMERDAGFKATPAAPARSGGDFSGSPGGAGQITEAQLAEMTPEQVAVAYREGRLKHLM